MNRRDFLKLMALLPGLSMPSVASQAARVKGAQRIEGRPNILILVFDTLSAKHMSLYGYQRETTPNLARFAERATVYHRHYSTGSFTNPGTASLLTGTYPWTHRSTSIYGPMRRYYASRNLFSAFPDEYYKLAYTHNLVAFQLLHQCSYAIDNLKPMRDMCLHDGTFSDRLFWHDYGLAAIREQLYQGSGQRLAYPTSLVISTITSKRWLAEKARLDLQYRDLFPYGVPYLHDQIFLLEHTIDWLCGNLRLTPSPYLMYIHVSPPHDPYKPRCEFVGQFNDGWKPITKPKNAFTGIEDQDSLNKNRRVYDEFVAYADAEFGRLYEYMERSGIFDDTYVVVTSDHGELFERGIRGHESVTLYDPIIHIPLIIKAPMQSERYDVRIPTTSIDVLPTLRGLVKKSSSDWVQGRLLPNIGGESRDTKNSIFSFDAKYLPKSGSINQATISLIKGSNKLMYFYGYDDGPDSFEFYNLEDDPDEMVNLYHEDNREVRLMREELLEQLHSIR